MPFTTAFFFYQFSEIVQENIDREWKLFHVMNIMTRGSVKKEGQGNFQDDENTIR